MAQTRTFLFTDIEGSTRRWEADSVAMGHALSLHDTLLRAAVESAGGATFKHTGDGLCAVFEAAGAAVAAAVVGQRGLQTVDWGDAPPLQVRMALHTGEAQTRGGDYFGPVMNRTARLMSAAHGGQILCGAATAELAREQLPAGIELLDLGDHRLRDLERSERVLQVTAADSRRTFPPLRTLTAVRHNLPILATAFFGRDRDLTRLSDLLEQSPLVTLIGMGGIGKTRLALEHAARNVDGFPDGVVLAELAPVAQPGGVVPAVAAAAGVTLSGHGSSSRDALVGALAAQRMLLVLDNCEHILDACADLVEELVARCPGLRVVATSREALGVAGEQLCPVGPLPVGGEGGAGSAATLFLSRAAAVRPEFNPGEGELVAIAEICRRLDGLPLAIELAAARVAHLGVQQIAARLDDRFRLLRGAGRRTDRHVTLRTTVAWSHDLLDDDERRLLRRLGVFTGAMTLEAVERVCFDDGAGAEAVDLLGSLVGKSLVLADTDIDPPRYRMLETVRLFAEEELDAQGEGDRLRERHLDWLVELVQPRTGIALGASDWTALEPLMPNVWAAMDWASTQGAWEKAAAVLSGLLTQNYATVDLEMRLHWGRQILAHSAGLPRDVVARVHAHAALSAIPFCDDGMFAQVEAAAAAQGEHTPGDAAALAWTVLALVEGVAAAVDPTRAGAVLGHLDRALRPIRAGDVDRSFAAVILSQAAQVLLSISRFDEVTALAREALGLVDEEEHWFTALQARMAMVAAGHLTDQDDLVAEAVGPFLKVANDSGLLPPEPGLAMYGGPLAVGLAISGEPDAACVVLGAVAEAVRRTGVALSGTDCLVAAGVLAALKGEWEPCALLLGAASASSSGQVFSFRSPAGGLLYLRYRDRARDELGPDRSRVLRDQGRALTYDDALALAVRALAVSPIPRQRG